MISPQRYFAARRQLAFGDDIVMIPLHTVNGRMLTVFKAVFLVPSLAGLSACGGSSGIDPLPEYGTEPGKYEGRLL